MKKNALQHAAARGNIIEMPGTSVVVSPKSDEIEFTSAEDANIPKMARSLGIPTLTGKKLKQYHNFGLLIRKIGIINVGKASLFQIQQELEQDIKLTNKLLRLSDNVRSVEDTKENREIREKLMAKKRELLKDLKDVAVEIIEAAQADGTSMEQAPTNRAFSSGAPVILAQNATFNQQSQRKD